MGALIFENEIGKFLRKQNSREAPCVRMRDNGSLVILTPSNSNFTIVQRIIANSTANKLLKFPEESEECRIIMGTLMFNNNSMIFNNNLMIIGTLIFETEIGKFSGNKIRERHRV